MAMETNKTILLREVISLGSKKSLGAVWGVLVDGSTKRVGYFLISDDMLSSVSILSWKNIFGIGDSFITVYDEHLINARSEEGKNIIFNSCRLVGLDVFSSNGDRIGAVDGFAFNTKTGLIEMIGLTNGNLFDSDSIIFVSSSYVFVNEDARIKELKERASAKTLKSVMAAYGSHLEVMTSSDAFVPTVLEQVEAGAEAIEAEEGAGAEAEAIRTGEDTGAEAEAIEAREDAGAEAEAIRTGEDTGSFLTRQDDVVNEREGSSVALEESEVTEMPEAIEVSDDIEGFDDLYEEVHVEEPNEAEYIEQTDEAEYIEQPTGKIPLADLKTDESDESLDPFEIYTYPEQESKLKAVEDEAQLKGINETWEKVSFKDEPMPASSKTQEMQQGLQDRSLKQPPDTACEQPALEIPTRESQARQFARELEIGLDEVEDEFEEFEDEDDTDNDNSIFEFLRGAELNDDVISADGTFVVKRGTILTDELLAEAKRHDALVLLTISVDIL